MNPEMKKRLRGKLTREEYEVIVEKATERPFSGTFDDFFKDGSYRCKSCGENLFESARKFDAGCGWPSFDAQANDQAVVTAADESLTRARVEILCGNCGAHLGHVFDDGPTTTGQRYCVNSLALDFTEDIAGGEE